MIVIYLGLLLSALVGFFASWYLIYSNQKIGNRFFKVTAFFAVGCLLSVIISVLYVVAVWPPNLYTGF
ncbi:MAG: hypothetical protein M1299_00910 [Firmicutes bacterium]|nr:hypothetical protein [Bacillota bacterium]